MAEKRKISSFAKQVTASGAVLIQHARSRDVIIESNLSIKGWASFIGISRPSIMAPNRQHSNHWH